MTDGAGSLSELIQGEHKTRRQHMSCRHMRYISAIDLQEESETGVSVGDVAGLSAVLCLHQLLDHSACTCIQLL